MRIEFSPLVEPDLDEIEAHFEQIGQHPRLAKEGLTMTRSPSHEDAKLASFRNAPESAADNLNAVLEDGDQAERLETLRYLAQAFVGVPSLAGETNLNATTLYRILSRTGNPELKSLTAMGPWECGLL